MRPTTAKGFAAIRNLKSSLATGKWEPTELDVDDWLVRACFGTAAMIEEVTTKLMSQEDMEDLRDGRTPFDSLRRHVEVWCQQGKQNLNR
jgi:hypothetical protein